MNLKREAVGQGEDTSIWYFVCDVTDALYKIPLLEADHKYFLLSFKGEYYIWQRLAQGSLNGPALFGRLSALLGRMTQGLISYRHATAQCSVDDPLLAIRASEEEAQHIICRVIIFWLSLGLELATHKAQFARRVGWIGYTITDGTASWIPR